MSWTYYDSVDAVFLYTLDADEACRKCREPHAPTSELVSQLTAKVVSLFHVFVTPIYYPTNLNSVAV